MAANISIGKDMGGMTGPRVRAAELSTAPVPSELQDSGDRFLAIEFMPEFEQLQSERVALRHGDRHPATTFELSN